MPREALRESDLRHCRALLHAGSKTFGAASRLLPARVRAPATVLYAFCRVADDAVDAAVDADRAATVAAVSALKERLARIYAGEARDTPVDRALSAVVQRFRVPRGLLDALLEGFSWDAEGRRYETLADLHAYAARVAGSVGAIMSLLMGPREPSVLARACDLGVAMQLTNIARDVGEDARRGRVYLPLAWMRREGLEPDAWLARPAPGPELAATVARLLDAADALYLRADRGITALPRDCRAAIFAARLVYADIGRYIALAGHDSVTRRAHVPASRKAQLIAGAYLRAWLTPGRVAVEENEPPLESTRFLIRACESAA